MMIRKQELVGSHSVIWSGGRKSGCGQLMNVHSDFFFSRLAKMRLLEGSVLPARIYLNCTFWLVTYDEGRKEDSTSRTRDSEIATDSSRFFRA